MTTPGGPAMLAVCATRVEAGAAARVLGRGAVRRVGMGAAGGLRPPPGAALVSLGVCGGLRPDVAPGTVVIPDRAGRPGCRSVALHPGLVAALRAAAERTGVAWRGGAMATSPVVVTGAAARAALAAEGWDAVDMETAALLDATVRVAAVRTVLDAPGQELDPAWARPWRALLDCRRWPEAVRLGRDTRSLTGRAARVVAAAAGAWDA